MTDAEICREFREAKNPKAQIEILADLNLCSKNDILKILMMNGQDVTPAGPKKPGGDNDKVLQLMYDTLDEIEDEIRIWEKKYKAVVETMKMYGQEKPKEDPIEPEEEEVGSIQITPELNEAMEKLGEQLAAAANVIVEAFRKVGVHE